MRLLEVMELPNGLKLEFWDESRAIAGDRWYVGLRAILAVGIPRQTRDLRIQEEMDFLRQNLGPEACFQRLMERHFVPREEVRGVIEEMKRVFLENSRDYLSKPGFAERFLLKKAAELREKRRWGPDYLQDALEKLRRPYPARQEVN
ncbi:MAG: hypothetical protein ACUVS3_01880 [Thermodesulfobacteriota bacterium]